MSRGANKFVDMTGRIIGLWTVLRRVSAEGVCPVLWTCRCECGIERDVLARSLRNGQSKSCGCERKRKTATRSFKHGHRTNMSNRTYSSWMNMCRRCADPKNNRYRYYGGRGISVCARWKNSFANFLADMEERPLGCTLDRIDPNGNYEPSNCRWATPKTQAGNRRKARR
jgi:hypothetical protein